MAQHPIVIAHHLTWTLYGWWLPNDPRGSNSKYVVNVDLRELGPLHYGRKLVLVLGNRQDSGFNDNLAARHDECIYVRLVNDGQLPVHGGVFALQYTDDGVGNAGNIINRCLVLHQG